MAANRSSVIRSSMMFMGRRSSASRVENSASDSDRCSAYRTISKAGVTVARMKSLMSCR